MSIEKRYSQIIFLKHCMFVWYFIPLFRCWSWNFRKIVNPITRKWSGIRQNCAFLRGGSIWQHRCVTPQQFWKSGHVWKWIMWYDMLLWNNKDSKILLIVLAITYLEQWYLKDTFKERDRSYFSRIMSAKCASFDPCNLIRVLL